MQLLWAMENHLSSQLAELKEVTDKTAEVAGDPHQLKGVDEVLRAASISRSSCRAARVEEYDKLTKQLVTKYFQTWLGVSGALILPKWTAHESQQDHCYCILDEFHVVHQVGEKAEQGRKEENSWKCWAWWTHVPRIRRTELAESLKRGV